MRHVRPFLLSAAAVTLIAGTAGCPDREVSEVSPQQGKVEYKDIPVTVNRDVDILFVIDNSGSMGEEQTSLIANFPKFIQVLETIEGGLPNAHIAVINSDMGTGGGPATNGCSGTGATPPTDGVAGDGQMRVLVNPKPGQETARFISDIKDDLTGVRTTNYTGSLSGSFSAMATVGTKGCGYESHLGAMRRALENPINTGFLRENAYLAVIIIADEDDCSVKPGQGNAFFGQPDIKDVQSFGCFRSSTTCEGNLPAAEVGPRTGCVSNEASPYSEKVADFVTYLNTRKAKDPSLLIVAGIVGNTTPVAVTTRVRNGVTVPDLVPSCTYTGTVNGKMISQSAFPAIRTTSFLNAFPNSTTTTICKEDLSDGLLQVAQLLKSVIGSPCIDSKLATPYQCSVSDVVNPGKPERTETVIARCDATKSVKPCWSLEVDNAKCGVTASKLALLVDRGGVTPPENTHVIANCVTE
jgi:hypothetical protein